MIGDELKYRIRKAFGHVPTPEQEQALDTFSRFMTDRNEKDVMVLRGSAGFAVAGTEIGTDGSHRPCRQGVLAV